MLPPRPSTPPGIPPPIAQRLPSLLKFGVVCSSNINRSMEAHVIFGNVGMLFMCRSQLIFVRENGIFFTTMKAKYEENQSYGMDLDAYSICILLIFRHETSILLLFGVKYELIFLSFSLRLARFFYVVSFLNAGLRVESYGTGTQVR
jgi:hypothetical protein